MADEWAQYAEAPSTNQNSSKDEWSQYATPSPQSSSGSDLSSIPDLPDIQTKEQPTDALNIGDHAALSFLTNPQDQKNYLQKKYPFVIPTDDKGNFMVGNSPDSLQPVNPSSSGNTFISWLASQANAIPSMVGMGIGAAGGVPGAAAGSAVGEAASKAIGHLIGSTDSLQKDAVDTAISGAFGAVGQKATQMFGLAANKIMAPKLAQAIDGKLTALVNSGKDTTPFINFVSTAVHFASGADKEDVATLMKYGVNKSLSDQTLNNKNAIINIAQDIVKATQSKRNQLGIAVGASNANLLQKAGNIKVSTSPIFDYIKQEINAHPGWGSVDGDILTLNRNAANSSDSTKFSALIRSLGAQDIRTSYQAPKSSELLRRAGDIAKDVQYNINNPTHQPFIEKTLGLKPGAIQEELERTVSAQQEFSTGGPRAFKIPTDGKINVKQAVGVQDVFSQLTNAEKTPLSDDMRRVFTNVLYRDGNGNDSPLVNQLSKIATANGVDEYVANKNAYKNFMKSIESIKSNGLDPFNPQSIQDYGKHINDRPPVDSQMLSDFENQVGHPILDNLKKYSAIQKLSNYNPNFLRLGLISGAIGGMLGDGDLESRLGRGAGFALGIPLALKNTLRTTELAGNAGKSILNNLLKSSPYIASQGTANLIEKSTSNSTNKHRN